MYQSHNDYEWFYQHYTVKGEHTLSETIGHFTVVCLVSWPWIESEAGVDLVLIETSLLFLCK